MRNRNKWVMAVNVLVFCLIAGVEAIHAQRLCEHNDNPVAKIGPCFGSAGTLITITPGRGRSTISGTLVFKRILANGVPSQVTTQISSTGTVAAPPQLCTAGNGKWEVWLVLASGVSQGKIGAFSSYGCTGGTGTGLGGTGAGGNNPLPPANQTIILAPITINVDNEVYAKTRSTSQSYIKNIASSMPTIATGTEWGTNELKIRGKRVGVTTISFLDDNTGTKYRITVTVVKKRAGPAGGDGAGAQAKVPLPGPGLRDFDRCLIGTWRSQSHNDFYDASLVMNVSSEGLTLTVGPDATATFDYSGVKPLVKGSQYGGTTDRIASTTTVTGKATARISDNRNHNFLADDRSIRSSVTFTESYSGGTAPRVITRDDLFLFSSVITTYACTANTLTLQLQSPATFTKVE